MIRNAPRRIGMTLIELLVVMAIIAILFGLSMVAVAKVRHAASFLEGQNSLRQIGVAIHNYAQANSGKLPLNNSNADRMQQFMATKHDPYQSLTDFFRTAHAEILPYVEEGNLYTRVFISRKGTPHSVGPGGGRTIAVFVNPLDPSSSPASGKYDYTCSYVNNAQVFSVRSKISKIGDGLSNTIFFTEHYRVCGGTTFDLFATYNSDRGSTNQPGGIGSAPTFADYGYSRFHASSGPPKSDYYPITAGNPPRSAAADNVTFQVRPSIGECDPRQPNAASSRGLQILMGDGSVRTVDPGVSPFIFWAAVTPNRAEIDMPDF
jgi:prepilin-type N-terminal cleavage/methylation domain-containing protein